MGCSQSTAVVEAVPAVPPACKLCGSPGKAGFMGRHADMARQAAGHCLAMKMPGAQVEKTVLRICNRFWAFEHSTSRACEAWRRNARCPRRT